MTVTLKLNRKKKKKKEAKRKICRSNDKVAWVWKGNRLKPNPCKCVERRSMIDNGWHELFVDLSRVPLGGSPLYSMTSD